MLTLLVFLIGAIAAVALVTAILAHFRGETFKDSADAELDILKDYVELELDKIRAKIDGGKV